MSRRPKPNKKGKASLAKRPPIKRRCVIDEAVGETRAAVYEGKALVELYTLRWSGEDAPQIGDIYVGRIHEVSKDLGAAFIDLGTEQQGFLRFTMASGAPRFQQGQYIRLSVTGERSGDKSVIVKFIETEAGVDKPYRVSRLTMQERMSKRFRDDISFETGAVNILDEACEREVAIPGGGSISVERTRAMWVIDIDRGTQATGFDASLAACKLIAKTIRLRGIGGLIAIDFPNLRQRAQRDAVFAAMEEAFAVDPHQIKIAPLSRFGVIEMSRSQGGQSLDAVVNNDRGSPTMETRGLYAIRQLLSHAATAGGAQLTLEAPSGVYDWLEADKIGWKEAVTDKIGARFNLKRARAISVVEDR